MKRKENINSCNFKMVRGFFPAMHDNDCEVCSQKAVYFSFFCFFLNNQIVITRMLYVILLNIFYLYFIHHIKFPFTVHLLLLNIL